MKTYAERNRVERQYQVGEQELLKLQPYAQSSVANRPFLKLAFKYFGPYTITSGAARNFRQRGPAQHIDIVLQYDD